MCLLKLASSATKSASVQWAGQSSSVSTKSLSNPKRQFVKRDSTKSWIFRMAIWKRFRSKSFSVLLCGPRNVRSGPSRSPLNGSSAQRSLPGPDRADLVIMTALLRERLFRQQPDRGERLDLLQLPFRRRKWQLHDPENLPHRRCLHNPPLRCIRLFHLPMQLSQARSRRRLHPPIPYNLPLHLPFRQVRKPRVEVRPSGKRPLVDPEKISGWRRNLSRYTPTIW